MSIQDDLIGKHHEGTDGLFSVWLSHVDTPSSDNKKHRELKEDRTHRAEVTEELSDWIINHHISEERLTRLEKKKAILDSNGFVEYAKRQSLLPESDKTKKGNATEVLLAEYLKFTSGLDSLIYRLRYNPNVDQSMKGDDVLLFDLNDLNKKIIVGEAKFRSVSNRQVVESVVRSFEGDKNLPMSIPFIAEQLSIMGNEELAEQLEDLNAELHKLNINISNVGLILSDERTSEFVETHMDSSNKNLLILSLGTTNHEDIINEGFRVANEKLLGK